MPRVFLGLPLPELVRAQLGLASAGIRTARWVDPESMHLTLHFIGDLEGAPLRTLIDALTRLDRPGFDLGLRGVGTFPPRGRARVLWAGVGAGRPELVELHGALAGLLAKLGIETERRKYAPHVTLARFRDAPKERELAEWIRGHALLETPPFPVDRVLLYSSVLRASGARYVVEAAARLRPPP